MFFLPREQGLVFVVFVKYPGSWFLLVSSFVFACRGGSGQELDLLAYRCFRAVAVSRLELNAAIELVSDHKSRPNNGQYIPAVRRHCLPSTAG